MHRVTSFPFFIQHVLGDSVLTMGRRFHCSILLHCVVDLVKMLREHSKKKGLIKPLCKKEINLAKQQSTNKITDKHKLDC